jgi:hypothetical protein
MSLDLSTAYTAARLYQSAADAAALAGAQELQGTSRGLVTPAMQDSALRAAKAVLDRQLADPTNGQVFTCGYNPNKVGGVQYDKAGCGYGPYVATMLTPSNNCVNCDSASLHSIQVQVVEPSHATSAFSLFGIKSFNIQRTSVAGIQFLPKYSLETLRYPGAPSDINLGCTISSCTLTVSSGDIGSNTCAQVAGGNNKIVLDPPTGGNPPYGYRFVHSANPCTVPANITQAQSRLNPTVINDPGYATPSFATAPTYANLMAAQVLPSKPNPPGPATTCPTGLGGGLPAPTLCLQPGIYAFPVTVPGTQTYYLLSGTYWFQQGLSVSGTLVGGSGPTSGAGMPDPHGTTGVVVVVTPKPTTSGGAGFSWSGTINLNWIAGCTNGCVSTPANDIFGSGGALVSPQGFPLTVEVPEISSCFPGGAPNSGGFCSVAIGGQAALTLGAANTVKLQLGGVIYAPSENFVLSGNFICIFTGCSAHIVGQIVVWTTSQATGVFGSNNLVVQFPPGGTTERGIVGIDAGCSPGTACAPPPY